jgi:hypothetical protein
VLRWTGRIAGVLLAPLVALSAYGVMLRIGQHGLTPSRIHAAACVVVAACYAAGYAWAAIRKGGWMKPLELTNWVTAQIAVAVVLILFSPLGDPARYSVNSQVARLMDGRIKPDAFDYTFLHFHGGRWGVAALKRLADPKTSPPGIAAAASAELRNTNPYVARMAPQISTAERTKVIQPVGGPLPAGLLTQVWPTSEDPATLCKFQPKPCPAITIDLGQGSGPQVVVFTSYMRRVFGLRNGHWTWIGDLQGLNCGTDADDVAKGRYRLAPSSDQPDLEIAGRRTVFVARTGCPGRGAGFYRASTYQDDVTDVAIVKPVPPPVKK